MTKYFSRAVIAGFAALLIAAMTFFGATAANATNNPQPVNPLLATAGSNGVILVQWVNPATDFDHTVITVSPGGQTYSGFGTSTTFSGLISGQTYTFTAVAYSPDPAFFSTPTVTTATATGNTVPGAATNVTGTAGVNSLTLSWTAPAATGGSAITSYTATLNTGQTCTTASTSCVISGLTNGTAYTATVTATNTTGTSAASAASSALTPATEALATTGTSFVLPLGIASASAVLGIWVLLRRRLSIR